MRLSAPARKPQSAADRAARRLLPRALTLWRPQPDWRLATTEAVVLMLMAIALSYWAQPADPFWTLVGFPWLWLISTLIALRYGALLGVIVLGVALASWFGLATIGPMSGEFPRVSFLGALLLVLIAGEFSDVWNARLNQAQAINAYVDERLQVLTHNHFLLSVSHERLEQELISRPYTMRETLTTLRSLMVLAPPARAARSTAADPAADLAAASQPPPPALPGAEYLLALLAQQCRLESAAIFAIVDDSLRTEPLATSGSFDTLDTADAMLINALESGQLTHLQSNLDLDVGFGDRSGAASGYQVCAPLVTSAGRVLGVLVVARMAFIALNLETLQLLTVLLSYYADGVDASRVGRPVLAAQPQCPPEFAVELAQLAHIYRRSALRSSVVAFSTPLADANGVEALQQIGRMRRALDVHWESTQGSRRVVLAVLPLTDSSGVSGFIDRIGTRLREQFGRDLAAHGVSVYTAAIDEREPAEQLNALLARVEA